MPSETENPAVVGRVSCDNFAGASQENSTATSRQTQFLIAVFHVRPELAAVLAPAAFGEHGA